MTGKLLHNARYVRALGTPILLHEFCRRAQLLLCIPPAAGNGCPALLAAELTCAVAGRDGGVGALERQFCSGQREACAMNVAADRYVCPVRKKKTLTHARKKCPMMRPHDERRGPRVHTNRERKM